jgi:hypothetical protein
MQPVMVRIIAVNPTTTVVWISFLRIFILLSLDFLFGLRTSQVLKGCGVLKPPSRAGRLGVRAGYSP